MINIDKFKTFIYLVANKNGRGTLTPSQFDSATERAVVAWTNNQISNQKQYQPGQPFSQTSMDLDQASIDRLRHLKEIRNIRVVNGEMAMPDGVNVDVNSEIMPKYWTHSRLSHRYQSHGKIVTQPIKVVNDNQWAVKLSSNIVSPTKKRAIANYQSNKALIEPSGLINLVTLAYIRVPNTPSWGYTIINNRPVYDAVSSVDIDAPDSAFNEIAMIALEFIGIRIREQELVQAAAGLENKGV
jgi:hypothetical protein